MESRRTKLTGDDGEFAPQIGQPNLRDIQAVNEDAALDGFHESEEGKRQGTLPRSSATQNADLLTQVNLEGEMVQHVG